MRCSAYSGILAVAVAAQVALAGQPLPAAVADAFACYTALPSQLVPVLQKIRSQESADAHAAELHTAINNIYTAREKLHHMPELTPAQNQQVREQFGMQMREEWARLYAEITRLRQANCFKSVSLAREFRTMCMMIEK